MGHSKNGRHCVNGGMTVDQWTWLPEKKVPYSFCGGVLGYLNLPSHIEHAAWHRHLTRQLSPGQVGLA